MCPNVSMFFAATREEFAFTAKRECFSLAAMGADVSGKATVFAATVKHLFSFVNDIFRKLVFVKFFKECPVVITFKDRFESQVFVHGRDNYNK